MLKMIDVGMKRRRKETWYVSFVTFIAVLFMTGLTLFQNIMNSYVFSSNLHNYGDWVISSVGRTCSHPYLMTESFIKTGQVLVNAEGKSLELRAGMADENFGRIYESVIYEGRMPAADGEIAMDVSALAMLGYSYELGQKIQVQVLNETGEIQSAEFLLVGTLKNFSAIWNVHRSFPLPNFLVREKDFEQFSLEAYTTYFYQLNPMYEEINTSEFASSFNPVAEQQAIYPLTYNHYVYENKIWSTSEMFDRVTGAIMLIGVLAIGYLMVAYTGKRRETYYRCRSLGASKFQIRGIVCFECMRITIPQIILGLAGAYGVAFLVCKIVQLYQFAVDFVVDGELFVSQLTSAFLVVVLAMVAALFSVSDKRIAGNVGQVKPSKYKRLRRIVKRA
ncbi:MAG: ABC transporter permease, partial [Agathobacter sp.]|nr:ABC transporter permease [Agathobacter sp.]